MSAEWVEKRRQSPTQKRETRNAQVGDGGAEEEATMPPSTVATPMTKPAFWLGASGSVSQSTSFTTQAGVVWCGHVCPHVPTWRERPR